MVMKRPEGSAPAGDLRPFGKTIPIIAMTANAFAEDIQKSKNAGINEHLAKPLEMDKVLKVIASYCK